MALANAKIEKGSIVLSSPEVKKPVAARYAWAMNPRKKPAIQQGRLSSLSFPDRRLAYDPDAELIEVDKPQTQGYQAMDWVRPEITE